MIILRDLKLLYEGGDLTFEGLEYCQWARVLRSYQPGPDEVRLWREVADDVTDDLNLQRLPREEASTYKRKIRVSLDQLARLRSLASEDGAPDIRDLILAAIGHAACGLDGLSCRYVTVENHGREPFDPRWQIGRTVGWFTILHPVRVAVADSPIETARRVRAWRGRIPYNGLGYGLLRGPLGSADAPLPPISFNYLGRLAGARHGSPASLSTERWQLDPQMFGLRKSGADSGTRRGTLDVTAWLAGDELSITIDSGLARAETERFGDRLSEAMETLCTAPAPPIARESMNFGLPDRHAALRDFDPMIVVEKAPGAPELFLLPPGEGGAESYLGNLTRHLGAVNQILFNNVHRHCRYDSFEEVGAYYLEKIRQRRPSGPYNLLGWSFGGVVALEIARCLAHEGGRVQNLILIDPFWRLDTAVRDLGLVGVSSVIDTINLSYAPHPEDFVPLLRTVGRVTLFKASVYRSVTVDIERRRLFEYYARSSYNHLDTLLPANVIHAHSLGMSDHFSWVQDTALVAEMGRQIGSLLHLDSNHLDKVAPR
jgi:N-(5-amino-5-carboxypentanoyl)-L-cysteinyl-D-valine synthase